MPQAIFEYTISIAIEISKMPKGTVVKPGIERCL